MNGKLGHNIYETNFFAHFMQHGLWRTCERYEMVLDVFIARQLSKMGKHLAFVHFSKSFNINTFGSNLWDIWIENFKIVSNAALFQRCGLGGNIVELGAMNVKSVPITKSNASSYASVQSLVKHTCFD